MGTVRTSADSGTNGRKGTPPEIELPERLRYLVKYCETACVAECCGIDAFDFSPLHVASYISASTRRIDENEIAAWEQEPSEATEMVKGLPPDEQGYVCSVSGMNQYENRVTEVVLFA